MSSKNLPYFGKLFIKHILMIVCLFVYETSNAAITALEWTSMQRFGPVDSEMKIPEIRILLMALYRTTGSGPTRQNR